VITQLELIQGLVFHMMAEAGTLAQHVKQLTDKDITDWALAQRRALLPPELFDQLMRAALKPIAKADPARHPEAFYHGLRLCGVDGSLFSVTNTPQVKNTPAPLAVLHTLCAFANDFHNLGGGYIVIGVAERDGQPVLPPVGLSPGEVEAIQKERFRGAIATGASGNSPRNLTSRKGAPGGFRRFSARCGRMGHRRRSLRRTKIARRSWSGCRCIRRRSR